MILVFLFYTTDMEIIETEIVFNRYFFVAILVFSILYYIFYSILNNSFYITIDKLIIKRRFLFWTKKTEYHFYEISKVDCKKETLYNFFLGYKYVTVYKNIPPNIIEVKKYHCWAFAYDSWEDDEDYPQEKREWETTFEDFYYVLGSKGVIVNWV